MRGRSFKLTQPAFIAFVMTMLLLSTFLIFVPEGVKAVAKTWNASANDDWSNANAWSPTGVPADGDDVVLDTTSTYNLNIDGDTAYLDSFIMDTGYTGTVSLNANTLSVNATADGSDFTGTQGTFNGGSGTVNVSGDITVSSTDFTLVYGTSTFDHTGTGTIKGRDDDQNSFYNLKVATAGKTTSIQDVNDPRVTNGQFTTGTGTLQRTGGTTTAIYHHGTNPNPFVNGGGTITLVQLSFKSTVAINIPAGTNYYHIGIQSNNGATLQGDITLSSQLFIGRGNPAFVDTANYAITTNELRIGASTYANYIDPGSSTIDIGASGVTVAVANSYILGDTSTWTVAGDWTSASTSASWDMGTSTVTFDGANQEVDANGDAFYDVIAGGTGKKTITADIGARNLKIESGVTWQLGKDTADASVTLTFNDSVGAGFHGAGDGTFITKGTSIYGMTLRSANSPPTTQWNGGMANVDPTLDWTTLQDLDKASGAGTWDVENTTFTHSGTDFVVHLQYLTKFANVTISTTTGHGMYMADDFLEYYNVVITSGSGKKDVQAEARLEFQYSNFDVSKVVFGGLGPPTGGNLTSLHHNDVVGAYKIGTGTIQYPRNLKKSQITHDFYSGCDVELFEGSFVIDENADADTMFIQSGAIVIHEAATTLDVATNLTVNGTFIGNGTVMDSGNYFDFWIGGGSVWLNNSTVSKAKLAYYYGGFNFTVGNSANSTINEWTLEAPSGIDTDFNITYYDFNNKNSGTIWRMTVTASSGSVKFCTSNLTSGQYYRSYVESISHTEGIADSGNYYNFSYNSWSTKAIYLTWFTPTPYNSRITIGVEGEEPGPGQWDRWTIGFSYSKHWITNEVRFHAIMIDETQRYNASYYIWEFGDGATYESASPNITHTFKWGLYTIEDVKLTVVMKNGVEYKIKEGLLLDNTLIVALICLGVITFAAIAIQRTRKKRQREELIMVETEGR